MTTSQKDTVRSHRLRWLALSGLAAVLPFSGAVWIDHYTAKRTMEEFNQRVREIREGMLESEVRVVAGPPDEAQDAMTVDRLQQCGVAHATAIMTYSVSHGGWISEKFDVPSGFSTLVVCLDDGRRVVNTYLEMFHI